MCCAESKSYSFSCRGSDKCCFCKSCMCRYATNFHLLLFHSALFFFFIKDLMLSSVDNFIWKTFILTRRKWWKSLTFKHSAVSVQRSNGNLKFWKPNVARNFLYRNGTKICDHDFYISHDCRSIIMSEFCAKPDFYYVQSAWIFIKTEYLSNDLPH